MRLDFEEPEPGVTVIKLTHTDIPEEDRWVSPMGFFHFCLRFLYYAEVYSFLSGELIVLWWDCSVVADMGMRLWWRIRREDGGILSSTR